MVTMCREDIQPHGKTEQHNGSRQIERCRGLIAKWTRAGEPSGRTCDNLVLYGPCQGVEYTPIGRRRRIPWLTRNRDKTKPNTTMVGSVPRDMLVHGNRLVDWGATPISDTGRRDTVRP